MARVMAKIAQIGPQTPPDALEKLNSDLDALNRRLAARYPHLAAQPKAAAAPVL
jgi:hypothetical protein